VQLIGEMLGLAERIEEKHLQLELLAFRIYDLSSLCDIEGIQRDLTAFGQISEEIGEPFYEYNYQTMSVAPMIQNGQFEDAERMTMAAFDTAQQLGVDNHEGVMGVQMFTIRREQGRLAEIAPVVQHFVNEQGSGAAWRPGLALIYADIGELGKARAEFELLAADQFGAIPRDSLWQTSLAYLAETCCAINAVSAAEVLYELLLPYRDLAVVVGNASVCLGATFQQAMEIDSRISATTWLPHTQFWYSRMLAARGGPEDIESARNLVDAAATTAAKVGLRGLQLRMKSNDG
jgi:hypothetical protein